MTGWTADAVLAAAADWTWVPPDARQVRTDDYQLVEYPAYYHSDPVKVVWCCSGRPSGELIDEVGRRVTEWGHAEVGWDVSATTRPAGIAAELTRRGATLAETAQVLAYDMTGGRPALDEPSGVEWKIVQDEDTARASQRIQLDVWDDGGAEPDQATVDRALAEARDGLAHWSSFSVVAFIGGQPASSGGCTLVDGVARFWGAGTRPALRGRGGYRVVLGRRMAVAREHGATLALVKGRADTSAPILRRAGFRSYGEQHTYRLVLDGGTRR